MDRWRAKVADVHITSGASDFCIYQQTASGRADIPLAGTWEAEPGGRDFQVMVRIWSEEDFSPVAPTMNWTPAEKLGDGTWSHTLRGVPAGGLYQIQTRLAWTDPEWTLRDYETNIPALAFYGLKVE